MKESDLLKLKNVNGWTYGTDKKKGKCLVVFVEEKLLKSKLEKKDIIPTTKFVLFPYPRFVKTDVIEVKKPNVGIPTASTIYRNKTRPFQPGQSISKIDPNLRSAGTLGFIAKKVYSTYKAKFIDSELTEQKAAFVPDYLLSTLFNKVLIGEEPIGITNYHVAGSFPSVISQPGTLDWNYDPGIAKIGYVVDSESPKEGGDTSIIRFNSEVLENNHVKTEILNIGEYVGFAADEDYKLRYVQKSGRTSGISGGMILSLKTNMIVHYDEFGDVLMKDLILIGPVTTPKEHKNEAVLQPGDSGSAILTQDKKLLALGFASNGVESFAIDIRKIKKRFDLIPL